MVMYMKNNLLFKILASLPIILLMLYFIPFLGIILILFRFFVYSNKKISTSIYITLVGILILIPKIIYFILGIFKIDINTIPYLQDVLNSDLYNINFINYSKLLICIGIIFLIISSGDTVPHCHRFTTNKDSFFIGNGFSGSANV